MEDTQHNRASDAAAKRKRRSSILKAGRSSRAPLSELEFKVATPTDTTKSRRVSFSRRTGVAEFITNEATTTWKNFYEEHNRTFESSGNETDYHAPRQSVAHLGKGVFSQQFMEVEAIDFDTIENIQNTTISNIKLDQLECDSNKLSVPRHNFEFSGFTDHHSKLFTDELAISGMGEVTDKISMNFSVMQPIGDDLDDIDLKQSDDSNFVHPRDRNVSEYFEVDLNVTHVAPKEDESDMSITDTIHSPKVNVSKTAVSGLTDKSLNKDWVADKENIVLNPYVAPKESANFAVNDDTDKVLVFDGKRLTIQSDKEPLSDYRKTLLPNNQPEKKATNSTIVLNVDDDLPNFVDNPHVSMSFHSKNGTKTLMGDDCDLSITQPIIARIRTSPDNKKTIAFEHNGNVSITHVLSTNILTDVNERSEKRQTIVFENDADVSITQGIPSKMIFDDKEVSNKDAKERRKTIVFNDDTCNISMTQAFPSNMILMEQVENPVNRNTTVYDADNDNIFLTPTSSDIFARKSMNNIANNEKRKTIVFDADDCNISMTQALPTNMMAAITSEVRDSETNNEKRKTIVFDQEDGNISMTQALPSNLIELVVNSDSGTTSSEKRKTIVFDQEDGNISMTQALPSNLIELAVNSDSGTSSSEKRKTIVFDQEDGNISMTQALPSNLIELAVNSDSGTSSNEKRKTIVFDQEDGNISMTQALPSNLIELAVNSDSGTSSSEKRKTIVFDQEDGNISMTQALPSNLIELAVNSDSGTSSSEKRKTIVFDQEDGNISMTQALPTNLAEAISSVVNSDCGTSNKKRRTIIFNEDDNNISMTQAVPTKVIKDPLQTESLKRRTIVFDNDTCDISMTQAIPNNLIFSENSLLTNALSDTKSLIYTSEINEKSKGSVEIANGDMMDMPVIQAQSSKILGEKRRSVVGEGGVISVIQAVSSRVEEIMVYQTSAMDPKLFVLENISEKSSTATVYTVENYIKPVSTVDTTSTLGSNKITPVASSVEGVQISKSSNSSMSDVKFGLIAANSTCSVAITTQALPSASDFSMSDVQFGLIDSYAYRPVTINLPPSTIAVVESDVSMSDVKFGLIDSPSAVSKVKSKIQKNILDDLLDMRDDLESDGLEDKSVTVHISKDSIVPAKSNADASDESLFYIRRDSSEETQTDRSDEDKNRINKNMANHNLETVALKKQDQHLKIEYDNCVEDLEKKLLQLQRLSPTRSPTRNRHFEKVLSSDLETLNNDYRRKSVKSADDTKDLLDMLSKFTEQEELEDPVQPVKTTGYLNKGIDETINKCDKADANKTTDKFEPRRLSAMPRRQSIVLSREDLMNNISMAQAALQTCAADVDSDMDTTNDTCNDSLSPKKNVRLSSEVVKTLRFEDEDDSIMELIDKDDPINSPSLGMTLKKTAFGETSYMSEGRNESKPNVIPSYLKDVSDGIKALMTDLVKPVPDVLPFETNGVTREAKNIRSTCSTQANLITSSQIDLEPEINSAQESLISSGMRKLKGIIKKNNSQSEPSCLEVTEVEWKKNEYYEDKQEPDDVKAVDQSIPGAVIMFDPNNPLNNVLLAPFNMADAHKYEPPPSSAQSQLSLLDNSSQPNQVTFKDVDMVADEIISKNYNVVSVIPNFMTNSFDGDIKKSPPSVVSSSDSAKPASVDQSVETLKKDSKDEEINTVIAMKDNKNLLEESSSLTLIDDPSSEKVFIYTDSGTSRDQSPISSSGVRSPVEVIYPQCASEKIDSDVVSDDAVLKIVNKNKRKHIPQNKHENCTLSALDTTPKPASKMPKRSISPLEDKIESNRIESSRMSGETVTSPRKSPVKPNKRKSPKKTLQSPNTYIKPGTNVMVQQALLEYQVSDVQNEIIDEEMVGTVQKGVEKVKAEDGSVKSEKSYVSSRSMGDNRMDWQLDSELSSKIFAEDDREDDYVVSTIKMLPFMGGECVWENASGSEWSFLLLSGRVRLRVYFEPPPPTARRARVAANTRVSNVEVESTAQAEQRKPIGVLCLSFAIECMQGRATSGCLHADEVPLLLRRCSADARRALRWARAMYDAWLHLAYTLSTDGRLVLKVANVPLRCVWEVSMRIKMESQGSSLSPRARDVCLKDVVAPACGNPQTALARDRRHTNDLAKIMANVPEDWGHVPRTIWKVFKYLKHKTRDDEQLLGF